MTQPKYPLRAINETGDKTIDVQLIQVPDSAITAGSGTVSLATATGDVTGPSSSTDNAIARFDSTTGKLLQNSAVLIADTTGVISGTKGLTLSGATSGTVAITAPTTAGTRTAVFQEASGTIAFTETTLASASLLRSYLATTVTYNANAVLANTPLSVTVAAGGIYAIELVVHSTSAVKGLLLDFGGTSTDANFIGEWHAYNVNDSDIPSVAGVTARGTDFNAALDGISGFYTFTGSVEITDAGTFLLRGAQNSSDASNTTILQGSTLILTKMN